MNTEMSIVLIHWKIKTSQVPDFEQKWKTVYTINNRDGLIGELLSRVERRSQAYPFITWPIACANIADEEKCTHYINVALWSSHKRFHEEVGHNMKDDGDIQPFEIERRRRVVVTPTEWRVGTAPLPTGDSLGTK
jgi:hypothetical protein